MKKLLFLLITGSTINCVGQQTSGQEIPVTDSISVSNEQARIDGHTSTGILNAQKDIKNGTAKFFCGGFIAVARSPKDKKFEKKYGVKYEIHGCVIPAPMEQIEAYHKTISKYLDKKYGREWRKMVRSDVHFIKEANNE